MAKYCSMTVVAPITRTCSFSMEHLGDMLRQFLPVRRFLRFRDFAPGQSAENVCLLRHDVDVSLEYAERVARVEQEIGVSATYFIRMRANGYNPLGRRGRTALFSIERGGGEVGLHYEGIIGAENPDRAWRRFLLEKEMLEDLLGHPVGVALHMPSRCRDFDHSALQGCGVLYQTSSDERFGGLTFVSDSNRNWRNGCLCEHLRGSTGLHALLHPVWWVPEVRAADTETIVRGLAEGD